MKTQKEFNLNSQKSVLALLKAVERLKTIGTKDPLHAVSNEKELKKYSLQILLNNTQTKKKSNNKKKESLHYEIW